VGNPKDKKIYDIRAFREPGIPTRQISGEIASFSGIYRLEHREHPVARELVVLKGSELPSCPACSAPITFELVRQADEIANDPDFG
jgi:hypothetical protein